MRAVLLLWLVLLMGTPAIGQHLYSVNYTVNDGLPSNTVRAILKDSHNRMWVGTAAGLCLFDGSNFRVIQNGSMPAAFKMVQPGSKVVQSGDSQAQSRDSKEDQGGFKGVEGGRYQRLGDGVWLKGEKGIAGENVFCITEDAYGAMWIGSVNGGLTRFNGRSFTHYTIAHGLVSNNVRELYYSEALDLLFVGTDRGFSVFNGRAFHSFHSFGDTEPFAMSFLEGNDYVDVLPYTGLSILRYHPAIGNVTITQLFRTSALLRFSPRPSTSPVLLPSGDTLVGYERKGFMVLGNGWNKSFTGLGQVFGMTTDPEGNAWIAAWSETPQNQDMPGGLYKYDGRNCIRYSEKAGITDPGVWGLYYDPDFQILWVGTLNSGLYKIPMSPFEWFTADDLPVCPGNPWRAGNKQPLNNNLNVFSLLSTASGDLFAGSVDGILQRSPSGHFRWLNLGGLFKPQFTDPSEFRCLREDSRGNVYASMHNPFLIQFSPETNFNSAKLQWTYESTMSFDIDKHDTVWYGNKWYEGVVSTPLNPWSGNALNEHVLHPIKSRIHHIPDADIIHQPETTGSPKYVTAIKTRGDTIWYVSHNEGLFRSVHGRFENLNLTLLNRLPPHHAGVYNKTPVLPRNISDFCIDEAGNLYLGTDAGDVWNLGYNAKGVYVKRILHGGSDIIGNAVKFLVIDHEKHLWAGTNLGLNCITLPRASAGNIKDNEVPASAGIHYRNRFYGPQSGYYDCSGSTAVADALGNLWIGTGKHLLHVNTHTMPSPAPNLQLTGLEVNMEPAKPELLRNGQHFKHDRNNLVINFATINYLNPTDDLYRYKVDGLTPQWTEFRHDTKAVLTSLNPGTYTFRAEAINLLNDSAKATVSYTFTILKPWYANTWLHVGTLLMLLAMAGIIIRIRERRIRREEQKKAIIAKQLATLEMHALQSQMNPHFIFNCISSIQGLILKNKTTEALGYLHDFSKLMRQTLEYATREHITLADELHYIRYYLNLEEMRFEHKFSINIHLDPDIAPDMVNIPPMILQPHIENAIHHGLMPKVNGDGLLSISFHNESNRLRCIIQDNGIGRQRAAMLAKTTITGNVTHSGTHQSHSTRITRERIEILNQNLNSQAGSIDIEDLTDPSGESRGTRVIIVMPV